MPGPEAAAVTPLPQSPSGPGPASGSGCVPVPASRFVRAARRGGRAPGCHFGWRLELQVEGTTGLPLAAPGAAFEIAHLKPSRQARAAGWLPVRSAAYRPGNIDSDPDSDFRLSSARLVTGCYTRGAVPFHSCGGLSERARRGKRSAITRRPPESGHQPRVSTAQKQMLSVVSV